MQNWHCVCYTGSETYTEIVCLFYTDIVIVSLFDTDFDINTDIVCLFDTDIYNRSLIDTDI